VKEVASRVLTSGGLDSTACHHFLQSSGKKTVAVFIDYNQPAVVEERRAARKIAKYYSAQIQEVHIASLRSKKKSDTDYIPARNATFLFSAITAIGIDTGEIVLGIHSGVDYPDCSGAFCEKAQALLDIYFGGAIQLCTPFITWTKIDIWRYCIDKGLPISFTYSCQVGTVPACGKCSSCKDRSRLNEMHLA